MAGQHNIPNFSMTEPTAVYNMLVMSDFVMQYYNTHCTPWNLRCALYGCMILVCLYCPSGAFGQI